MHPKAARLALHGFVLCWHPNVPRGWRIKQQHHAHEIMLALDDKYPGSAGRLVNAACTFDYDVVPWDSINTLILGEITDEMIESLIRVAQA